MNGILRPDLGNFLMIGGIAFLTVWLIDRGLRTVGYHAWTTTGQ